MIIDSIAYKALEKAERLIYSVNLAKTKPGNYTEFLAPTVLRLVKIRSAYFMRKFNEA